MNRKVFLLSPLAWAATLALAQTLPTGGTITQGRGSVSVNGNGMLVRQDTARMVADWQSFSIGSGASVRFQQPSSNSVALNRVLGADPSVIMGNLSANGHVYLQNAAGVLFAPGAQVDVGSLVATSLNADVGQFMAGRLRLSGADGAGAVRNEGRITAAPGGYVVLAAPQVSNSGRMDAPFGTAALAAGGAVEIDPTGAGLMRIRVPVAAVAARLANSGSISADGGRVALQAAATDAALGTVMQVGGIVRARSIEQRDGRIVLSGGRSGIVEVDGRLDASGGAGQHGGTLQVLGERVALLGDARLDASGDVGGGTIHVGGGFQGQGPERNARASFVAEGARLDASARGRGDGGEVVVWSDGSTTYRGSIAARGGAGGGDGGRVEVSGKALLGFDGQVDTRAPRGRNGELLLDPTSIIVGTVADVNGDSTTGDDLPAAFLASGAFPNATSRITSTRVASLLATGDVQLQATSDISVDAALNVAAGGAASTLILEAPSVTLSAPLTLANSGLRVATTQAFSDNISVNASVQSLSSVALTGTSIFLDDATISAPNVTLTTPLPSFGSASIGQTGPSGIIANTLTIARGAGAASTVTLDGTLNQVGTLSLSAGSATINLTQGATPVRIGGTVDTVLNLTTTGAVTQAAALGVGSNFTLTAGGAATLANAANDFAGPVFFDVGGALSLRGSGDPLRIGGTAAGNVSAVGNGVPVYLAGDVSSTAGSITITGVGFDNLNFVAGEGPPAELLVSAGQRFLIRSSDFTQDQVAFSALSGSGIGFSAAGTTDVNATVLSGWTGALPASGNLYVTNRTGTISAPNSDAPPISRAYDGTTGFTYTQTGSTASGLLDGGLSAPISVSLGNYTLTGAGTFVDKNAGTDKGYTVAASNNVVATALDGSTYHGLQFAGFTRPTGPVGSGGPGNAVSEITPRAITSTGIAAIGRVYDGSPTVAVNTAGATLNGTIAGDTVTLIGTGATGTMSNGNAGAGKAVAVSGLTLGGADASNYSVSDASGATVTITRKTLTATGLAGVDRVYNGGIGVAVDTGGAALAGTVGSDVVTVSAATGTLADKNVGTNKAVTIGTITLAGADAGNYTAVDASSATADVTPRPITSTGIRGVDRVYDGGTTVALNVSNGTLNGVLGSDVVNLAVGGATGAMSDKNAGTAKPVAVVGSLALTGADAANYSVTDSSSATVTITPRPIASSGLTGVSRVYDGGTSVAINTANGTLTGTLAGDTVTVGSAIGSVADKNVGTNKVVTIATVTLAGADAGNYVATDASNTTADITPRAITSTGITAVDRVYDGTRVVALNAGTGTLTGVISGDSVGLSAGSATGTMADKNVGTAKPVTIAGVTLSGADAANYSLTDNSRATVDIAALTLTASGLRAINRVADGSTTVDLNTSGAALSGVLAGDVVVLDTSGAVGSIATPDPALSKPVTVTGMTLTGADAANYAILPAPVDSRGAPLDVRIMTVQQAAFEDVRHKQYLQGVSDAQEPFRRAMAEALAAGFGKENIRKQLGRGLVFETGLAAPAVDAIDSAKRPAGCSAANGLSCAP